jgi:protein TonB
MTHWHRFPLVILILAGLMVGLLAGCAGSRDRPMQLVSGAGPVYPFAAKVEGMEGSVVVRYGVTIDGRVINARIDSAEPPGMFEEAAITAVRSWRYNPALRDGEPVAVENVVSVVHFKLGGGDRYADY